MAGSTPIENASMKSFPAVVLPTRVRWTMCALVFFATTINYVDRQLFSLLVPFFENDLRLSPTDLALINVSFLFAYGFGMVLVGRLIDRVGTKRGLSATFVLWNLASMAHALVGGFGGFAAVRFALGVGESGNFPACVKTIGEWFPRRERALATGWFNSGGNVGAIAAPLLAVPFAERFGWRACFLVLGGVGMVWLLFWTRLYRRPEEHPSVSPEELAFVRSDPPETVGHVTYAELFGMRPVYGIALAKLFSDAPWWFYLTWLPKFLVDEFHLTPTFMSWAIPVVYVVSDFGSVGGGWLSSSLIAKGRSIGAARKTTMLACALLALPVMLVGRFVVEPTAFGLPSIYPTIFVLSLAAAAHQGFSSNLYTLVSDTVPRAGVAMAVGIIQMFGVVGSAIFQLFVGRYVENTGSYGIPFLLASALYLLGLGALQLVLPRVEPTVPRRRVSPALVASLALTLVLAVAWLQYGLNKPRYASVAQYVAKREEEKGVSITVGPDAKVGWMSAKWFVLRKATGEAKPELVKIDDQGRPAIETKGTKAKAYVGPSDADLAALTGIGKTLP